MATVFEIKPNEKFACIAFENVAFDTSLPAPLSLDNGL